VLRPGIDTELFQDREKASETIRIAFMPRKNKALVERIRQTVEVMLRGPGQDDLPGIEWVPIAGLDAAGVAAALGSAHVFLASGFPEGCPLPPLEAMASGCVVAGFAGYGGFDYMRPGLGFPGEYTPWFPLREVPWGPNGLFCADADVLAAANALVRAVRMCAQSGEELEKTRANARLTAEHYALDVHRASALKTLTHFTD
jgi:glycosyltransferase involved in cell wall biosynthesis